MVDVIIKLEGMTERDHRELISACAGADKLGICRALYSHLRRSPSVDVEARRNKRRTQERPMDSINTFEDLRRRW